MDSPVTARDSGSPGLQLSTMTPDGEARRLALEKIRPDARQASAVVTYRSGGRLLIIATSEDEVGGVIKSLPDPLRSFLFVNQDVLPQHDVHPRVGRHAAGIPVVRGRLRKLSGHLGEFRIEVNSSRGDVNLAEVFAPGQEYFDLVLDLTSPAAIQRDILPPGYFAPGTDPDSLRRALAEIPETIGEFEKPKFFHYNPDICAHGSSGLSGCTRCLDVCPTWAISSIGDKIAVDAHLCQGAGSCATVCPTGAITYAYPPVANLLDDVRTVLKAYRDAGGAGASVLFHDADGGRQLLAECAGTLPETVIPFEVEEVGSVGMDTWLATLAYGATRVALLATPAVAPSVLKAIADQVGYTVTILDGMGYSPDRLQLVSTATGVELVTRLAAGQPEPEIVPAGFVALNEKRNMLRLAVDHLHGYAAKARRTIPMPAGAPFGEIVVNRKACTLCMACVAVCPASALSDGADLPQLSFHEWNCVQCGLCETACPENAITRSARFIFDPEMRQQTRVLNEQQPFHCVQCGKPFATQALMDRMKEKLKGHWMFDSPDAMRRLQMCEDCRVKSMFRQSGDLIDVHRPH